MMKRKERRKIDGCSLDDGAGGGNRVSTFFQGWGDFKKNASSTGSEKSPCPVFRNWNGQIPESYCSMIRQKHWCVLLQNNS
jgi:hypothetical protein